MRKLRVMQMFKHHFVRNSLLQVWLKYVRYLPDEKLLWTSPEEIIQFMFKRREDESMTYQDLIRFEGDEATLRTEQELGNTFNWWAYLQIRDLFNSDKINVGFRKQKKLNWTLFYWMKGIRLYRRYVN